MQSQQTHQFFDQAQAAEYDNRFAKLAPIRDALHLLISAIFADLPEDARILCVGAGTGSEILHLAGKFPKWRFTAVEPSGPMLDVCRRRTGEAGLSTRCEYHEGYLDSLPPSEPFDAATSLLVSHFILSTQDRTEYFRTIASRVIPGGLLANAELASDPTAPSYDSLMHVWLRLLAGADLSEEKIAQMRAAYQKDVAILPLSQVAGIIATGGFETPVQFLQTGLIHGWYAKRGH